MKKIAYILSLLVCAGVMPLEARNNKQNAAAQKAYEEKKRKQKAEREARAKVNQEIEDFIADRDKNNDNSLTLEEFASGESNATAAEGTFKLYNKNKDRYLSKTEVKALLGL